MKHIRMLIVATLIVSTGSSALGQQFVDRGALWRGEVARAVDKRLRGMGKVWRQEARAVAAYNETVGRQNERRIQLPIEECKKVNACLDAINKLLDEHKASRNRYVAAVDLFDRNFLIYGRAKFVNLPEVGDVVTQMHKAVSEMIEAIHSIGEQYGQIVVIIEDVMRSRPDLEQALNERLSVVKLCRGNNRVMKEVTERADNKLKDALRELDGFLSVDVSAVR